MKKLQPKKVQSATMYLTIRVDYNYPLGMDKDTREDIAQSLAVRGNSVSCVEGVSLTNVEICGINE